MIKNRLEKVLEKEAISLTVWNPFDYSKIRQSEFFIKLDADWLPYIDNQTNMADQQNETLFRGKSAETNDKYQYV